MIRLIALLALATPAMAFDNDYARVFADHPDAITRTGDTTRRLDLPGPVRIVETTASDGSRSYYGYDESPYGSAACMLNVMIDLTIAARSCGTMLTEAEAVALDTNLRQTADYVAANTVPPVTDVAATLDTLIAQRAERLTAIGITCPDASTPQAMSVVRMMTSERTAAMIGAMTETPRLPVPNPCAEP